MRRFPIFIFIWGAALLLSACSGRGKALPASTEGDTLSLRYAENLMLVDYPGYTVATLRNPWDTLKTLHTYILVPKSNDLPDNLPAGTVVRTPLTKAVVYSSVHCGLLHELGAGNAIGGVCDLKYIKLPELHKAVNQGRIADCGDGMNPDMERIIDLHPDAILLSPFENSGGYGRVENWERPSSNAPTIWKLRPWDVQNGCASMAGCSEPSRRPTACSPAWTAVTTGSNTGQPCHPSACR